MGRLNRDLRRAKPSAIRSALAEGTGCIGAGFAALAIACGGCDEPSRRPTSSEAAPTATASRMVRTSTPSTTRQRSTTPAPSTTTESTPSFALAPQGPGSCDDLHSSGSPIDDLRHLARSTPEEIDEALRLVHCHHPDRTAIAELGISHQGHPILAMWIGEQVSLDHDRPSFFLNGSHHGDELISSDFVLDAIATLVEAKSESTRRWLREAVVVAVPLLNPDGRAITLQANRSGRKNGRDNDGDGARSAVEGVDLNRNYPFRWGAHGEDASRTKPEHKWYRGPFAGSEPETRAVMRLAIAERFVASVSFHSGAVALLAPYTIGGVRDPEPDIARIVARGAHRAMPRHPQGLVEFKRNLYPVDGTDQDWHYARHGTVALLFEGALKSALGPWHRQRTFACSRALWGYLVDRHLDGPSVYGRIVDAQGRPVVATVSIAEIQTHEGEHWRSRCRDGRFDRYLPAPGTYTLEVDAPGFAAVSRSVNVRRGLTRVDIELAGDRPVGSACSPPIAPVDDEVRR